MGLKPAMRCKAEILLGRVEDAINVPVQAIFRQGPVAFVYVKDGTGFAQRQIELGRASELLIEVKKGIEAGDKVLLREPKAFEITSKLDPSVFEMANASAPGAGGGRPPMGRGMNASPAEGGAGAGAGPRGGAGSGAGGGAGRPPSGASAGGPSAGGPSAGGPNGAVGRPSGERAVSPSAGS
jgi:hypothetical protein